MFRKSLYLVRRQLTCPLNEIKRRKIHFPPRVLVVRTPGVEHFGVVNNQILTCRNYAKSRDIKKEKQKKVKIYENELGELFDIEKLFTDMKKPLELFKEDLTNHTSLRSAQGVIENLKVKFDDNLYTIQDLADVSKKSGKMYVLDLSSFPGAIQAVVDVLQNSELNLNVQQDGTTIFVPIPKVTREQREVLVKRAKAYFVKCKDSIRNVQMQYIKKMKNIERLSQETMIRITDQLTALADQEIKLAEEILKGKQDELLKMD